MVKTVNIKTTPALTAVKAFKFLNDYVETTTSVLVASSVTITDIRVVIEKGAYVGYATVKGTWA